MGFALLAMVRGFVLLPSGDDGVFPLMAGDSSCCCQSPPKKQRQRDRNARTHPNVANRRNGEERVQ